MPQFKVKVLADSISPCGVRLTTVAYQAPRSVLAEVNTHRALGRSTDEIESDLSRNAESSRAIPFNKKVGQVLTDPYTPDDLPDGPLMGESPGMQASAPLSAPMKKAAHAYWKEAAANAAKSAHDIASCGFHKQDVNRLLEPFGWTRGIISATDMANFFALRCDHRAYPPFRFLARCIWVAVGLSEPKELQYGDWHLPFITNSDKIAAPLRSFTLGLGPDAPKGFEDRPSCLLARWSAARCARVSYYHFGRSTPDYAKDDDLFQKLAGSFPMHSSPLEHQAICAKAGSVQRGFPPSNYRAPWVQHRKFLQGENVREYSPEPGEVERWNVPDSVFEGDPGTDW